MVSGRGLSYSFTQRPRKIVLDNGLLWLSTNWIEMNGFPPVPPRTGCLGIVTVCPAGITVALAVDLMVKVWVPARLFSNKSWTPIPPMVIAPWSVICGPGELSQPDVVMDVRTFTGVWKVVLAVVVAWATLVRPRTAITSAAIAVFFIMFFRKGFPLGFPISFNSFERAERLREMKRDLEGWLQIFQHVCIETFRACLMGPRSCGSSRRASRALA